MRIESRKLDWNTSARTSTLRPGGHQAGGGDKKVGCLWSLHGFYFVWKDFSELKSNHVQIEQRKLNWKAESKVGSLEKVKRAEALEI